MEGNERAYARFLDEVREIGTLRSCAKLLGWDQETFMPAGGATIRAEQLAVLQGLAHRRIAAPSFRVLLDAAEAAVADTPPDSPERVNVREARREHEQAVRVPAELVEERARVTTFARRVWVDARRNDDFESFRPWLERILDVCRRTAEALGYDEHPYDPLLDRFEPGETVRGVRELFAPLREAHVELLGRILESGVQVDTAPLLRTFPVQPQEALARAVAQEIGFDFQRGRLDTTAHPFCSGTGPGDVRLTTRYNPHFFSEAFFSVLHEAGHGLYEQGLDPAHHATPMGAACSFGIHESQSRLWENFVGRSLSFWEHYFPQVQLAFPTALGGVTAEEFWRAANDVRPSLIRVEADEITYNLHIFLRFELETAMLTGDLPVADLPGAWNEAFERDFGLRPPDDAQGCLQDIHWSSAYVGYFPTYALGNVYAAQLHAAAERELGPLDGQFRAGDFAPLLDWLRRNIHAHGKRYPPHVLIERVTGAPRSPQPLIDHLANKFSAIYGL